MSNLAESTTPSLASSPCTEACPTAIGHILVCLDRSTLADGCLPYARFVADAFGSKITLLHVMPPPPGAREANRADPLEWEIAKREAEQYLMRASTSLGIAPQGTETRLIQGFPADQIVASAREVAADLTILSSHGEGGRSASDLGSVAQHVLGLAGGSVLLYPAGSTGRIPPKRILVPLDGSVRSETVLPVVAELARYHASEVLLVHVVTDPTSSAVLSGPEDMRLALSLASRVHANAEAYLARIRARLLPQVPEVKTTVIRRTEERQALLDLGGEQSADMVVLTAHGSTCNVERAFGSVASYLLAHTTLPIFVFQDMPQVKRVSAPGQPARVSFSPRPMAMERD
ncbi:MAG: universal stress protein [Polyangiaceae bacterium]